MHTHRHAPFATLAIGLFAIAALFPQIALAQLAEEWRMAGTMNGWNTQDDEWLLDPVTGKAGVYAIERNISAGELEFKFVRGGDWAMGNLGASGESSLEMPGEDIRLSIPTLGSYRIELDTVNSTWSFRSVRVSEPILSTVVRGTPIVGGTFVLDLSGSLTRAATEDLTARVRVTTGEAAIGKIEGNPLRVLVTPRAEGPLSIDVDLMDEGSVLERTVEVDVSALWEFEVGFRAETGSINSTQALTPVGDGVFRGDIPTGREGELFALSVMKNGEVVASLGAPVALAEGNYAVEVRDGVVTREASADSPVDFLLAGYWTEFNYTPAQGQPGPESVFITGDFNNWAVPGMPGVIEMASLPNGGFTTLVDIPEGAHAYGYLLNGSRFVADANNPDMGTTTAGARASFVRVGPSPEDFPLPRRNQINVDAIRHNPDRPGDFVEISRDLGLVDLSFTALPGDIEGASFVVEVVREDGVTTSLRVPCRREADPSGFERFTARVMTGGPVVRYALAVSDGTAWHTSALFEETIGDDPLLIPDWAKGAVWYQIFAERFRNGNPLNDPNGPDTYLMPWTADWYSISEEEYASHRERYGIPAGEPLEERTGGDLFHVVWDRRFGGDLQGVVEKLDYLQDLGITAIYFNPVFEGQSMHKYDATDFAHIDDNFGRPASAGQAPPSFEWPKDPTTEPADHTQWSWSAADRYFLDVLLPEAKRRGIRIVIDGVWNHTGRLHWAFQDVVENGAASDYADWFFVEFDENGDLESWVAWDGPSGWLPKFNQLPNRDLIEPVREHIYAVTSRWMDPNGDGDPSDGVDGWRLDVPLDIGLPFWEGWREHVKSINPDAVIIAEIWSDASEVLRGLHFDTQMHYPFAIPVTEWLAVRPGMTSQQLAAELEEAYDEAPQTLLIHQNLFASHDTDRYVSMLYNPGRGYDRQNRKQDPDGVNYKDTRPDERTYALSKLGLAIQATYKGAPMVYYGDELGMWGADDPTDRKTMPWPDKGTYENPDDAADFGVHRYYRQWLNLRKDPVVGPVLRFGDVEHLVTNRGDVFAFQRSLNDKTVRVVVNKGDAPYSLSRLNKEGAGPDAVGGLEAVYWVIDHAPAEEAGGD